MTRPRALASLHGLAVGDALGAQHFVHRTLRDRILPPAPWPWTDDTEMACAVLTVLTTHGTIDQDTLAQLFAEHHDFDRGYGPATNRMLRLIRTGSPWRTLAADLFDGQGSYGNGAAMRVAPLGAWFAPSLPAVVTQARLSATVTHTHPEAVAGAIAVAVAAALACAGPPSSPAAFLSAVLAQVPPSSVRAGLAEALELASETDAVAVSAVLGNGRLVSAVDTVPFAVWAAAVFFGDYAEAIWATASAGGDVDTTCAIVGGILGAAPTTHIPPAWTAATEHLPDWLRR